MSTATADAPVTDPTAVTPAPAAPAAVAAEPTTADLAKAGDTRAFNALRERQIRGDAAPTPRVVEPEKVEEPAAAAQTSAEPPAAVAGEEPVVEQTPEEKAAATAAGKALNGVKQNRRERREASFQERINSRRVELTQVEQELTAKRAEQARIDAEIAAKRQPAGEQPTAAAPANDPEPKVNDFENYEQFTAAQARWIARQEAREAERRLEERLEKDRQGREANANAQREHAAAIAHATRVNAFKAEHPDFDNKVLENKDLVVPGPLFAAIPYVEAGPALLYHLATHPDDAADAMDLPWTPDIRDAVVESPSAVAMLSYLVEHPEECARIASLPQARQAREMGKLEARLTSPSTVPTSAAVVVSKAPEPPKTVGSSAAATTVSSRDLAKSDPKAFRDRRDREERERRYGPPRR